MLRTARQGHLGGARCPAAIRLRDSDCSACSQGLPRSWRLPAALPLTRCPTSASPRLRSLLRGWPERLGEFSALHQVPHEVVCQLIPATATSNMTFGARPPSAPLHWRPLRMVAGVSFVSRKTKAWHLNTRLRHCVSLRTRRGRTGACPRLRHPGGSAGRPLLRDDHPLSQRASARAGKRVVAETIDFCAASWFGPSVPSHGPQAIAAAPGNWATSLRIRENGCCELRV